MDKQTTRVREDRAVRRAQLLDQAIDLIGQRGYHGFTIQALAERCGISNAGVLHYFPSKDRLLLAVLDEIERRDGEALVPFAAAAVTSTRPGDEAHAATLTLLRTMIERIVANPEQARFMVALQLESLTLDHPAHGWFRDREREATEFFTRLLPAEEPDPSANARLIHALMYGLLIQWLRDGEVFDPVAEWERTLRIVLPRSRA